ncbi:sugar transferase [Lactiplantibacillus plantarum]|uniref:sugar transferase n=1 Tax=Lactiplantibacillus plantarum TaxID=1590 RepID=UPI001F4BD1C9|nr:sugar transferase [Lactiplantibacillus plantarum]UNB89117.1 sugar transferase [Lactiplantibacillus plantarum]
MKKLEVLGKARSGAVTDNLYTKVGKRAFDFLVSIIGLFIFAIAYIILFIPYMLMDPGPMLFQQSRLGKDGKIFKIYKFRSMRVNADEYLHASKELFAEYVAAGYKLEPERDPRMTKIGRFIRKTSIDELPQFINVFKGEMSLVGPRPIVVEELEEYGIKKGLFLKMKPGITGVWQTSGRSNVTYPARVDLELSYLNQPSFFSDVKILFLTAVQVVMHDGAY